MLYIEDKMRKAFENLQALTVVSQETLRDFRIKECGFKQDNVIPSVDDSWDVLEEYMSLSATDQHYWIIGKVHTPKTTSEDQFVVLDFVNPAGHPCAHTILYINGEMTRGLHANHTETILEPDTDYDVALYAYYGEIHP